jgi:hypothetical protein
MFKLKLTRKRIMMLHGTFVAVKHQPLLLLVDFLALILRLLTLLQLIYIGKMDKKKKRKLGHINGEQYTYLLIMFLLSIVIILFFI